MKTLLKLALPLVLATGFAIPAANADPGRPDYRNDYDRYASFRDDDRRGFNAYSRQARRDQAEYERERRKRIAENARENRKFYQAQQRERRQFQAQRERAYRKGLKNERRAYLTGYDDGFHDGYYRRDGRYRSGAYNDAAWSVIVDLALNY